MFEIISKEEAKERLDNSPGQEVIWASIDKNLIHKKLKIKKSEGKRLINAAKEIAYQDNTFFGTLSLHGMLMNDSIQNILFAQETKEIKRKTNKCSKTIDKSELLF